LRTEQFRNKSITPCKHKSKLKKRKRRNNDLVVLQRNQDRPQRCHAQMQ
jgi:hypothetical protein